jgi:outer membrane lipoprotein-sorting protein
MNKLIIKRLFFLTLICLCGSISAQEGTVNIDQSKAIDKLLEFKKDIKTVETFRIQVYSGSSSSAASNVKAEFKQSYGQWPVEMVFNTPNYKIWVGNFRDRLEADRALLRIKKSYMNPIIFKPKKD